MVREFGRMCEKRKLKVNVKKSKVMRFYLNRKRVPLRVRLR